MPPKRKARSSKVEKSSEETKNGILGSPGIDEVFVGVPAGSTFRWQLRDAKKQSWDIFSQEVGDAFTGKIISGIKSARLKSGPKTKFGVDFEKMLVTTDKGEEKMLRGLLKAGGTSAGEEDSVIWEINMAGDWKPLQVGVCLKLEQMKDISSEVVVGGFKYDLDRNTREAVLDASSRCDVRRVQFCDESKFKKTGLSTSKITLDETDEDDDAAPVAKKSKKDDAVSGNSVDTKSVMKSVIRKGLAPVDGECPQGASYHVYTEGSEVWDCMLNQTNIQSNNNKYYLIQLLEKDAGKGFAVWMRWGRVGYSGQNSFTVCGSDLEKAKSVFVKKFNDKTRNSWNDRENFEKVAGKYDLVKIDYGTNSRDASDEVDAKLAKVKGEPEVKEEVGVAESKLPLSVQQLVSLICDIQTMEQAVTEMQYDTRKAPLGKVTTEQISAGYAALKRISEFVKEGKLRDSGLVQACNDFYTRIPHEFGFKTPPLIKTKEEVKSKLQLLEALSDIQVALKLLSDVSSSDGENPVDRSYAKLDIDITPVAAGTERKLVEDSIQSTHASTHSLYSMQVEELFALDKGRESKDFKDLGNRKLLFHGSRLSNWAGILSQGLRIAPPEAPVTGYMFGKGVYFADMSSKSANYCFASRSNPYGLLLMCEVSLGTPNKLLSADYHADKLPPGTNSTMGQGRVEPTKFKEIPGSGLCLPLGPPKDTKINNKHGYTLNYNEFIVYDIKQIKMKYLAKIKFNYKY